MSPTKRTSANRKMFIFNLKFVVRAVQFMLPAAIVLAMVCPASAVAITWNRTSGTGLGYWDTAANWTPVQVPGRPMM